MAEEIVTTDVTGGGANEVETEVNDTGATPRDEGSGQEKTYTQADFEKALEAETDRRVRQATNTLRAEWQEQLKTEKKEAARLAKMSADERAKAEFEKQRKTFEDERQRYNAERLEFETTKQLANEGLPVGFAKILSGKDTETTQENIKAFKDEWEKALGAAVNSKLKSAPPKTATETPKDDDPFLRGFNTI